MKDKFKVIITDQFVRISLLLSLIFITPLIIIIIASYNNLPPLIPFYNSMPWGEERLAYSNVTILLPIILLAIFIGNILQATIAYAKYVLVARIVLFNCFLFLLLGLLAYLQILFLTF
ncbi:MAG: hypothetical protein Q7T54_05675 [Candidatus Levybacteria bacterium]|nr:hypothetical protein [Candidatus Levybacteria bacterium]